MTTAFISISSNISPEKNVLEALRLLASHVKILKISTVYLTEPLQGKSQPKYYNCVVKIETDTDPHDLKFDVLRPIEEKLGRKRTENKYASRTIDLDLIAYGDLCIATKELVVPDSKIQERAFLAVPLYEIEPGLQLPCWDKSIEEIADSFEDRDMIPLEDFTNTLRSLLKTLCV
jgi:2-amino-4-hydroxy-6-hydroxymethyldihydropteridine diphosphokinase